MVPKRLKEARISEGLTQEALAELAGIEGVKPRTRMSNYEVGRFTPSFDVVVRIAEALDYPECYFYTLDDGLAKMILDIHRNRLNPKINSYYSTMLEIKKMTSQLNDFVKKAVD